MSSNTWLLQKSSKQHLGKEFTHPLHNPITPSKALPCPISTSSIGEKQSFTHICCLFWHYLCFRSWLETQSLGKKMKNYSEPWNKKVSWKVWKVYRPVWRKMHGQFLRDMLGKWLCLPYKVILTAECSCDLLIFLLVIDWGSNNWWATKRATVCDLRPVTISQIKQKTHIWHYKHPERKAEEICKK